MSITVCPCPQSCRKSKP